MSDRVFAQSCPNCGGVCPRSAETCKYCKFSFAGEKTFSLGKLVPRKRSYRIALIIIAALLATALVVLDVLRP